MKLNVSVVVRTKNEEKWISRCLSAIFSQSQVDQIEVVLVDSGSTDNTIQKASRLGAKIVKIDYYKPGFSINKGVSAASHDIICLLSAHCIPYDDLWLYNLIEPLIASSNISATYGRQIPVDWTNPHDLRDLAITFGQENRIQTKDTFFHNANSAFLKKTWDSYPFDDMASNIEDRLWAENLINDNKFIMYVASAKVYHWHGIHHYGNPNRALTTATVIRERTSIFKGLKKYIPPAIHELTIVILDKEYRDTNYLSLCLESLLSGLSSSSCIKFNLIFHTPYKVSFDCPKNITFHWIHRDEHSINSSVHDALKYVVSVLESSLTPEIEYISTINLSYLFRDFSDLDDMINLMREYDLDHVTSAYCENIDTVFSNTLIKKIRPNLLQILSDESLDLLLSLSRSQIDGMMLLPGYFQIMHISALRNTSNSLRTAIYLITGQEKILKFSAFSQLTLFVKRMLTFEKFLSY